jgi:tetratricopeptide (TPR) repeat protein
VGGLGKTWLLEKIIQDSKSDSTRFVPEIIDFFDTANHSIRGLQTTLRQRLNPTLRDFEPYDEALAQLSTLSRSAVTPYPSAIASMEARVNRRFIECCQRCIAGREVILLFDTFERVQQRFVGRWLIREFFPQVHDIMVAVAGRPVPGKQYELPDNFLVYDLPGLSYEEVEEHVRRGSHNLSPVDVACITKHTGGAPLLIDLILALPEPGRAGFIRRLSALPEGVKIADRRDLQRALLEPFAEPHPRNYVIRAMAFFCRRFDLPMLRYLTSHPPAAEWFKGQPFEAIFRSLPGEPYIKEYPQLQSHLLHDEVQRLVSDIFLREDGDLWQGIQDDFYPVIVDGYYPEAIAAAQGNLDLQRQLSAERMGYVLDRTPALGFDLYLQMRDLIEEKTLDYDFEELLWGEVREHLDQIAGAYQVCAERGEWLLKQSLFAKAESHYQAMFDLDRFAQEQVASAQGLGFALMRQGNYDEARDIFTASLSKVAPADFGTIAMIENNLGQEEQAAGRWQAALGHYAISFRTATRARDWERMSSVYLNRGFLYAMAGKHSDGQQECERALRLLASLPPEQQKTRDNIRRAIYAQLHLGVCKRHQRDFAGAADAYDKCLNVAVADQDLEGQCQALQHLGINAHLQGRSMRRILLAEGMPGGTGREPVDERQRQLEAGCELQWQAWGFLMAGLQIAQKAEWRSALADGLNRLAKVYREVDRIAKLVNDEMPDLRLPETYDELAHAASEWTVPMEVEYEEKLLTRRLFKEMDPFTRATRLFDLSSLLAAEVNDFHRAIDSLTDLAKSLVELENPHRLGRHAQPQGAPPAANYWEEINIVLQRMERFAQYDAQEEPFNAMVKTVRADLDYNRGRYEAALAGFRDGFIELARSVGFATFLLHDRLRDLTWRLRDLPVVMALDWCDVLEDAWQRVGLLDDRPGMLSVLERARLEALEEGVK